MTLLAPPGYRTVVPFDRERHRGLGVAPAAGRFAAGLNAVYLTVAEFFAAARDYPIAFARADDDSPVPLAVCGLAPGENLFVDAAGRWDPACYVPAYVRRYPFCTAPAGGTAAGEGERVVVCVDETALEPAAPALLDDAGAPTAAFAPWQALIDQMEAARLATERLAAALLEHDLLEPFEAQVHPTAGTPVRLTGLERVAEPRLNALPGEVLRALAGDGMLSRIYAHLWSLDNFARLLERRDPGRATAAAPLP